jgi:TatD family-associated radical SAM protein
MQFDGHNLDLGGQEPSAQEVLTALDKELQKAPAKEVVFCGYGECTMRLPVLLEIGRTLKAAQQAGEYPLFKIRLNTNGLGNLINKRNIAPELKSAVDKICISLNAQTEDLWRKLMRPAPGYENGFQAVLDFIRACANEKFDSVTASCVENTGASPEAVQALAAQYGAQFHEREFLDEP